MGVIAIAYYARVVGDIKGSMRWQGKRYTLDLYVVTAIFGTPTSGTLTIVFFCGSKEQLFRNRFN
jgi:hypothetical protein